MLVQTSNGNVKRVSTKTGAPHRCKECKHHPGPRSTNNVTSEGASKKAACSHECHF